MGLQLIFVVETDKKCKSDQIYIKDTIEQFYQYDSAHTKFSFVYMDGKGNYDRKKIKDEIKACINPYRGQSFVIYCFDCDDYDSKPEDLAFLNMVNRYCANLGYEFVWFCKDIESVYLGRKVPKSQKKAESASFRGKKQIGNVNANTLLATHLKSNTSNLMIILDKYLERKN